MKWGWMILMVFGVMLWAALTMADEPVALKNCRAEVDRLEKKVKSKEKDLSAIEEKIKKQEEKITKSHPIENKWGKLIDATRDEIRELKKKLEDRHRKSGGQVGTGRNTRIDRYAQKYLDGNDTVATALQKEIAEKLRQEKELLRKAEKEVEEKLGVLQDFVDWRIELAVLKTQTQPDDKKARQTLKAGLSKQMAELARKRKECQALAQNTPGTDTGQPPSGNGVVTFIGGMQIPTPKSGMDLPIEDESGPNFEDSLAYLPLLQISYNDPRTKAYYDALKTDFKAVFGTKKDEKMPPTESLFSKSGAEYSALFVDSKQAGWKNTPIRPYYGTYLVFIECAKQIQFRFHVVQPNARSTYGGVHIFGLQPGRHPVRMVIATDDGQRFETHFALIVKHEPEKRKFTNFEMGPDGKMVDTGKTIVVDLNYLKKTFRESWGNHMQYRAEAQKKGDKNLLRATLEMGGQLVYSHVEKMKNQPGCKTADVDPLLAKGGGAVTLLISQFGADINDHGPWQEMLRFAKLCKGVGSRTAYDVLAAVVQHASNIAPKARQDTLGYAYELLGEIALMQGRFEKALAHLNTGLEYHKRVNPNYLTDKGRAELPSLDQLKYMLGKMTG
jgi:hypothetical protein